MPGRLLARPFTIWIAVAALYGALTLAYAWPLVITMSSALPNDIGDPGLNTWILWWNAHATPLTTQWWDAPIFFPLHGAFALSETLLGIAPLTTALQWLGCSPVAAYNCAFLLSFVSAAFAAHMLAWHLTGRHDAALLAGLAYGFNPYRAAQLPHLQTLLSCWMPIALLGLHSYVTRRRVRYLLIAGGAWLLNGLTTGYFLVFFAVLSACWMVWFVRRPRDLAAVLITLGLASVALAPLLIGYYARQRSFDISRGIGEIEFFSADLTALWASAPAAWWPSHWTITPRPEGELYPGVALLGLVAAGCVYAARRSRAKAGPFPESSTRRVTRRLVLALGALIAVLAGLSALGAGWTTSIAGIPLSTTHPHKTFTSAVWLLVIAGLLHPRAADLWRRRSAAAFYPAAAVLMFVFALGPLPHAFGVPIFYQAPYAWLMRLPGGNSLRVPARFEMLVLLCLAQSAALAFARLAPRGTTRARGLCAALAVLIALDGWIPAMKTDRVPTPLALPNLAAGLPILELPTRDLYSDTTAMLQAMSHRHPLVNGYSGYLPSHYVLLQEGLAKNDADVVRVLQETTPLVVVVDGARDADGTYRRLAAALPGAVTLRETPQIAVYSLPQQPAQQTSSKAAAQMRMQLAAGR